MKNNKLQKNNSILEEKIKEQTGWNIGILHQPQNP
jgi:hypothetical protein